MIKKLFLGSFFLLSMGFVLSIGGGKALANHCFNPANGLTDSSIDNAFPRQNANRNHNGGCASTGTSHIFLSSYYATSVGGGPGSTLNTPTASLSVFFIGSPPPGAAINMDINVLFCMYGGVSRPVYISYGPNSTIQVGAGTRTLTLAGSDYTDVSSTYGVIGGLPIYKYRFPILLGVDSTAPRNCEVTASVSQGQLTFTEDNNPSAGYADSGRPNQNTFSTQNGQRAVVPAGPSNSAFAYRSSGGGAASDGLEYVTPFAPSCSTPAAGQLIQLRVYDADAPGGNPAGTDNASFAGTPLDRYPRMEVWEYDVNGNYIGSINPTGDAQNRVGVGNDSYGQYGLIVYPNRKYVWHWWNVSLRNGLQLWMPFSEISARPGAACPNPNQPPTGSISLSCVYDSSRATGARIDFNVNRSDPENDAINLTGFGHNVGGRPFNTWSGSFDGNLGEVGNAIAQITDNQPGPGRPVNVGGAGYTCPPNRPPVYSLAGTAVCSVTGALPVNRELRINFGIVDPDGGVAGVRVSSNGLTLAGPPYAGYILNANGNFTSNTNYPSPARNGVTYTVTFEGRDAQSGAWSTVGTATYFCYRNPASYTCTIISSGSFEPGEQLQPVVQVDYNVATGPLSGSVTYSLRDSSGVDVAGSPQTAARNPLGAGVGAPYGVGTFAPITLPSLGTFTQSAFLTLIRVVPDDPVSAVPANCGGGVTVASAGHPYFKVVGGDIVSSAGRVQGWNRAVPGHYNPPTTGDPSGRSGAGVTGAIVSGSTANNDLNGVMSSYFNASGAIKRLTFGNTGAVGSVPASTWGGGFGAPALSTLPSEPPGTPAYSVVQSGEFTSGSMSFSGGILAGTRMTVYVTGNLNITGPVTYPATYANISNIPHIRFVVSGNIYIAPGATVIDGEYMSAGRVYTCHDGSAAWGTPIVDSVANLAVSCGAPLRVNGALVGSTIRLTRTTGLLRNSAVSITPPFTDAANTAEIITFSPEIYLSAPFSNTTASAGSFDYDSVTSLPPLF